MIRIAFLVTLLFASDVAFAKCAMHQYLFEGVVKDAENALAVKGAHVYVFLDRETSVWSKGYQTAVPEFAETDEQGAFRASSYLDTYKGARFFFFGDDCSRKPNRADVLVIAPGFLAHRMILNDLQSTSEQQPFRIPTIVLSTSGSQTR